MKEPVWPGVGRSWHLLFATSLPVAELNFALSGPQFFHLCMGTASAVHFCRFQNQWGKSDLLLAPAGAAHRIEQWLRTRARASDLAVSPLCQVNFVKVLTLSEPQCPPL